MAFKDRVGDAARHVGVADQLNLGDLAVQLGLAELVLQLYVAAGDPPNQVVAAALTSSTSTVRRTVTRDVSGISRLACP